MKAKFRYRLASVTAVLAAAASAILGVAGVPWAWPVFGFLTVAALVAHSHFQMVLIHEGLERRMTRQTRAIREDFKSVAAAGVPVAIRDLHRELLSVESQVLVALAHASRDQDKQTERFVGAIGRVEDQAKLLEERLDALGGHLDHAVETSVRSADQLSNLLDDAEGGGVLQQVATLSQDCGELLANVDRLGQAVQRTEDQEASHFNALQSKLQSLRVADEQLPETLASYMQLRASFVDHSVEFPPVGGWAVTAPTLVALAWKVLESPDPLTIVELGSGTSSVWIGLALKQRGAGHCWSVESDPEFAAAVRAQLVKFGVAEWVTVVEVALVPMDGSKDVDWYDPQSLPIPSGIDILFVDGPPARIPTARYPAFPHYKESLSDGAWVVLDDTIRAGERSVFQRWQAEAGPGWELKRERDLGKSWLGVWRRTD